MSRSSRSIIVGVLLVSAALCDQAVAAGTICGVVRFPKIKGKPSMGYVELYEWSLFGTAASPSIPGFARRVGTSRCDGATCIDPVWPPGGGSYCKSGVTAATYSLLVCHPYLFAAPKMVPNVHISDGQTTNQDVEVSVDYSTYFTNDWTTAYPTWLQTFVATGYSIRGVAFAYAGNAPDSVIVSLLADDGNANPASWPVVGSAETSLTGSGGGDNWVRSYSRDMPTVPSQRYAILLRAVGGSGNLQPFKRNKDGNSYADGRAYRGDGQVQNYDLNITVFSDNDSTMVTMINRKDWDKEPGGVKYDPNGSRAAYGQTFIAHGNSLAAAYLLVAGGDSQYYTIRWKVRQGGPNGPQIGTDRLVPASWDTVGSIQGVSFNAGEIPLTPCQTYFIEARVESPAGSLMNPCLMRLDSYAEGICYRLDSGPTWTPLTNEDLWMTIMEYAAPSIELNSSGVERSVYKGDSLPNDVFTIRGHPPGTLCYTISDDAAWLSENPTNGCSNGEADPIQIIYNVAGLPNGVHHATITITSNAANCTAALPVTVTVHTVKPDFDGDTDVDQADFGHLQHCFTGPGATTGSACQDAMLDNDEDVDQDDFAVFLRCMSGDTVPAVRTCAD